MVGDIELRAFQQLIDSVLVTLNEKAAKEIKRFKGMSPSDLEVEVFQTIKDACGEESFFQKDEVKLVSGMRFPDILVGRNFGVEVKSTNKDHWTSTGSSIVESTRDKDVECIYLLFGKLGGDIPGYMKEYLKFSNSDITDLKWLYLDTSAATVVGVYAARCLCNHHRYIDDDGIHESVAYMAVRL